MKILAVFLFSFLFLLPPAFAVLPSQIKFYDSHFQVPFYGYADTGNCWLSCLRPTTGWVGGYDDLEYESNKWANYTNLALSAASNPVQDFAVGVNQLVTNLTAIGLTGLEFEELTYTTFGVGMPTLHVYSASAMPKEVTVIEGNLVTPIPAGSYVTTAAAFTACSAPCVYGNSANKSVIVKAPSTMPEVVDVYITPIATNSGPPIWPVLMVMAMFVIAALYWKQKRR